MYKHRDYWIVLAIFASCIIGIISVRISAAAEPASQPAVTPASPGQPAFIRALSAGKTQVVVTYANGLGYDWEKTVRAQLDSRFGHRCQFLKGVSVLQTNSNEALSDFGRDQRLLNPDAVIWDCSYSDAAWAPWQTPEKAKGLILSVLHTLQQRNPPGELILMIGYPPAPKLLKTAPRFDAFAQMYRQVAAEQHLLLIDCAAKAQPTDHLDRFVAKGFFNWDWPSREWIQSVVAPQVADAFGLSAIPTMAPAPPPAPATTGPAGLRFLANLRAGRQQLLVALGTSVTQHSRWQLALSDRFAALYPGRLLIKDAGAAAQSTKWGLGLAPAVADMRPDAVIIEYAINDAWVSSNLTVAQARQNLDKIIAIIKSANPDCDIILQTMDACTGKGAAQRPNLADYYQMVRDDAHDHHYLLVDHYPNWKHELDTNPAAYKIMVPDGVHPSPAAQLKIMMPEFEKTLFAADKH